MSEATDIAHKPKLYVVQSKGALEGALFACVTERSDNDERMSGFVLPVGKSRRHEQMPKGIL